MLSLSERSIDAACYPGTCTFGQGLGQQNDGVRRRTPAERRWSARSEMSTRPLECAIRGGGEGDYC